MVKGVIGKLVAVLLDAALLLVAVLLDAALLSLSLSKILEL